MSMLYLVSSIVISATRPSGRSAASRSTRVLTFHCAIVSLAARSLVTRATADPVW